VILLQCGVDEQEEFHVPVEVCNEKKKKKKKNNKTKKKTKHKTFHLKTTQ